MNDVTTCCTAGEWLGPPDDPLVCDEIARLAKALAHPTRVQILRILLASEACMCGDIVEQVPLAQSTVSQHLKVLRDAGLITGEIDGPRVCYCVDASAVGRLQDLLGAVLHLRKPVDVA